jgi:hypothetical protein
MLLAALMVSLSNHEGTRRTFQRRGMRFDPAGARFRHA